MNRFRSGIADYAFVEELGSGNYGVFWKAVPPARLNLSEEHVAVKVLHHRSGPEGYRRMANELRVYQAAESKHLVKIFDAGHEDGTIFYACEYSPAGSLSNLATSLSAAEKIQAVAAAARGADALHSVGVAHRDITPSNVMMFEDGARLADLGLAQILNPGQTSTGLGPVGSIAYQSPEMVRGEKATRASDIFALGATLHMTLTGLSIFPGLDGLTLKDALRFMLQPQIQLHPGLASPVAEIVLKATDSAPGSRYNTALAFAEVLEQLDLEDYR